MVLRSHREAQMRAKLVLTLIFLLVLLGAVVWFMGSVGNAQHQTDTQIQQYASEAP